MLSLGAHACFGKVLKIASTMPEERQTVSSAAVLQSCLPVSEHGDGLWPHLTVLMQ